MILEKKLYKRSNRILNLFKVLNKLIPSYWSLFISRGIKSKDKEVTLGAPVLTTKEDGKLACTSCFLCQDICPSHCISIEANPQEEEAAPVHFDVNILRCTFCGLCEVACPVDAIRMDGKMPGAIHSEMNLIWDKEYLAAYSGDHKSKISEDRPLLPY
ncbi:MAG: formate hydrogenlyase subunit 6/NADH:ubiquinone oxidoreductase subunit I [Bacteriovoracaceae bacterium]|jgi:formate hydrogenlyase subunit 6/NADH:ubiquinone oxidoreductase subunit I